jgi:RNA 3'-terminal phosphate cyclase (ATP)
MIEIDGSKKSGSGTILRLSIAIAAVTGQPLHIYNIRQNRPQRGLKPQHLEAVSTAAKLCNAELQGATLGSREIWFKPQTIKGGKYEAEIGTAGSIPMLILTILPTCISAQNTIQLHITKGGTDTTHSPTINYMRFVLLPTLQRMGIQTTLTVQKYGYYPRGMGEATITIEPCKTLRPFRAETFGKPKQIKGISICTFLDKRKVAERQATTASTYLKERGLNADIQITNDRSNPLQKGSSITLWCETYTGAIVGADSIGERRKTSETVGKEAAETLYQEIVSRATVDTHLADMLIPYIAFAHGESIFLTRSISEHLDTNIWLAEKILNVKFTTTKAEELYKIERAT